MKSHKYWSIGALITMLGTFYTGYKGSKEGHKYFGILLYFSMVVYIDKLIREQSVSGQRKKQLTIY